MYKKGKIDMKHYFVGVDIGTSNVVMVVGSKTDSSPLFNIEGVSVQPSKKSVLDGLVSNIEVVGNAIKTAKKELETELGIKIEQAYAGIGSSYARSVKIEDWVPVKNKKTGVIGKEDILILEQIFKQVKTENRSEVIHGITPLCYYVNGEKRTLDPVGQKGSWLKGDYLFSICISEHLRLVKMAFVKAGIDLISIFVNPMITSPLLLSEQEAKEGAVIVDIGGGITDITVVKEGRVQYFVSIPIGAESIDSDLKSILPPNSNIASVKHKYGHAISSQVPDNQVIPIGNKNIIHRNIATVIEARLMDIAEMVLSEVRQAGFGGLVNAGIVLTGGSVAIEGIDLLFERETSLPCRKATQLYGLTEGAKERVATFGQQTAVAIMMNAANFAPTIVVEQPRVETAVQRVVENAPTQQPQSSSLTEAETEVEKVEQKEPQKQEKRKPEPKSRGNRIGSFIKGLMGYSDPTKK